MFVTEPCTDQAGPPPCDLSIEEGLEQDYRRLSSERSIRFNTAYAEAFEAMTCAMAITRLT